MGYIPHAHTRIRGVSDACSFMSRFTYSGVSRRVSIIASLSSVSELRHWTTTAFVSAVERELSMRSPIKKGTRSVILVTAVLIESLVSLRTQLARVPFNSAETR